MQAQLKEAYVYDFSRPHRFLACAVRHHSQTYQAKSVEHITQWKIIQNR